MNASPVARAGGLRLIETQTTKTHCPYCAFQCGMTVTTTGGDEMVVQGDVDFPVNRGQMCIKGFTSAALIDHPARLTSPQLRTARGALSPVTWDTALDFIAERLIAIRDRHGADA